MNNFKISLFVLGANVGMLVDRAIEGHITLAILHALACIFLTYGIEAQEDDNP